MLILKVVADGPIHGYAIAPADSDYFRDVLRVQQGSLYPALHRLENRHLLKAGVEGHGYWQRRFSASPQKAGLNLKARPNPGHICEMR
jgi:DNA-binding PadR family transcriptional regulator